MRVADMAGGADDGVVAVLLARLLVLVLRLLRGEVLGVSGAVARASGEEE